MVSRLLDTLKKGALKDPKVSKTLDSKVSKLLDALAEMGRKRRKVSKPLDRLSEKVSRLLDTLMVLVLLVLFLTILKGNNNTEVSKPLDTLRT